MDYKTAEAPRGGGGGVAWGGWVPMASCPLYQGTVVTRLGHNSVRLWDTAGTGVWDTFDMAVAGVWDTVVTCVWNTVGQVCVRHSSDSLWDTAGTGYGTQQGQVCRTQQ